MSKLLQNAVAAEQRVKHDRDIGQLRNQNTILQQKYGAVLQQLTEAEKRCGVVEQIEGLRDITLKVPKNGKANSSTAILVLSDWHVEETVDPQTINGLNKYDLKIAETRIAAVISKFLLLLESWRKTWPINDLVVGLLGDMITGYIHEELVESNALSPTEAVLFAAEQISAVLNTLKKEAKCKSITVLTSYGNHGRTTLKPRVSTAYKNSYEWLMYKVLENKFAGDPVIRFKVSQGYLNTIEVEGHLVRAHHGDAIKFEGGVGGITIPVNKKIAQWNKSGRAALDIFGHWHQFIDHWNWVSNGCLIGYNAYALKIAADFQPPTQSMIIMSRSKGKVAAMPIFVD